LTEADLKKHGPALGNGSLEERKQALVASMLEQDDDEDVPSWEDTDGLPRGVLFEYHHFQKHKMKILYPPPALRNRHPLLKRMFDDNDAKMGFLDGQRGVNKPTRISPQEWTAAEKHVYGSKPLLLSTCAVHRLD
jgi:hypothetical protein